MPAVKVRNSPNLTSLLLNPSMFSHSRTNTVRTLMHFLRANWFLEPHNKEVIREYLSHAQTTLIQGTCHLSASYEAGQAWGQASFLCKNFN